MTRNREYREPTHCPLCGADCEVPDPGWDPERLECPEHGAIDVECYVVEP